jgi:hypothetical protein
MSSALSFGLASRLAAARSLPLLASEANTSATRWRSSARAAVTSSSFAAAGGTTSGSTTGSAGGGSGSDAGAGAGLLGGGAASGSSAAGRRRGLAAPSARRRITRSQQERARPGPGSRSANHRTYVSLLVGSFRRASERWSFAHASTSDMTPSMRPEPERFVGAEPVGLGVHHGLDRGGAVRATSAGEQHAVSSTDACSLDRGDRRRAARAGHARLAAPERMISTLRPSLASASALVDEHDVDADRAAMPASRHENLVADAGERIGAAVACSLISPDRLAAIRSSCRARYLLGEVEEAIGLAAGAVDVEPDGRIGSSIAGASFWAIQFIADHAGFRVRHSRCAGRACRGSGSSRRRRPQRRCGGCRRARSASARRRASRPTPRPSRRPDRAGDAKPLGERADEHLGLLRPDHQRRVEDPLPKAIRAFRHASSPAVSRRSAVSAHRVRLPFAASLPPPALPCRRLMRDQPVAIGPPRGRACAASGPRASLPCSSHSSVCDDRPSWHALLAAVASLSGST